MNLKRNVIANFVGRAWSALMALAFLPFYIRILGIESYGLIGVFISLTAVLSAFDMGLSTTLNRQLASLSPKSGSQREARDLVRTFELIYWGIGFLLGVGIALLAPLISRNWLSVQGVAVHSVEQAIQIMGLIIALQWPNSLYSSGLMGLQRQVLLNSIRVIAATLQSGGALLVLMFLSPTILGYFCWQVLIAALHTVVVAAWLWKAMPGPAAAPVFRASLLASNWRFAGGVTGITVLTTVLTQTDKIILSKLLSLEMFGYYSLAATVGGALNYISTPIFSAMFPKFSEAIGRGDEAEVAKLYHKSSQLMTALITPVWIFIALFSEELLMIWLGDASTVGQIHFLVGLLVTGTALNAFVTLPYALQLAYGWTSLLFYKNLISIAVFVPLLVWLISNYGAAGAALAWIILNAGYVLILVPLMHRRVLRGNMARWYLVDVGLPVLLCTGIGLIARAAMPSGLPVYAVLLWITSALALTFLSAAMAMPHTRQWIGQLAVARLNNRG